MAAQPHHYTCHLEGTEQNRQEKWGLSLRALPEVALTYPLLDVDYMAMLSCEKSWDYVVTGLLLCVFGLFEKKKFY